ncbi:MAG: hypothetical protein AAF681_08880 [Pseudomonadota bacterium]
MTRMLVLTVCAIATCAAFVFFWSIMIFLTKEPDLKSRDMLDLSVAFGLFLAASITITTTWKRKKAALWCWLPIFLVGVPTLTSWVYETTKAPTEKMQFTREQDAAQRSFLGEIVRPTRAEFDENRRRARIALLGLLGILSFQTIVLVFLHRKQVLQ